MQNAESLSQEQIREFLKSSEAIEFVGCGRRDKYAWVERVLRAHNYGELGKRERGLVRAYVEKVTGMSVSQTTRLIRGFLDHGAVRAAPYQRHRFRCRYTPEEITLLVEVDRAHGLVKRAGHAPHSAARARAVRERNMRGWPGSAWRTCTICGQRPVPEIGGGLEATRSSAIAIGERRKPEPQGRPGFLRMDTVHQGDWEGVKGVYHINAVDTVTQWQVVGCASRISEAYLLPVLEAMLHQFPFKILGFHSDNGSEYMNWSGEDAAEAAHRVHPQPSQSHAGQRAGGGQKWSDHSQAHGLRAYRCRARRGDAEVLRAAESVSQLSPAVRLRYGHSGRPRQAPAAIQERRLCDAIGEAEVAGTPSNT